MAEIVNLRRARKAKQHRKEEKAAAANRLHFGTAKRERDQARSEREKAARDVEGHRLEKEDES
jgi:hypothetical protein